MTDLTLSVHTSPTFELPAGGLFSPTTSTLVLGPTEVLLADTQYLPEHVDAIRSEIASSGRTLTTIFITHAHSDHYFGLQTLLTAFPGATAVATPAVAAHAAANLQVDRRSSAAFFGGAAVDNDRVPDPLDGDVLAVDGVPIHVIELPQADIHPTAALHIPSLDAVIAGDAIYNGINPFLALSGPTDWPRWVHSVETIAALNPRTVVAGHKRPELPDAPRAIAETRAYLQAFIDGVENQPNSRALVAHVQKLFPEHGNPTALVMSAITAFKRKKALEPPGE